MKTTTLNFWALTFIFTLLSCGQAKNETENSDLPPNFEENKNDTFVITDTISNCNYKKYVNGEKTSKLAKAIFYDKNWDLNDDNVHSFFDSLTAKEKNARPFYFRVVTNSFKKSDGYYSEGLGGAGKDYVEENTKEFTSYFDNKACFSDRDLQTWADIVMLEFSLLADNEYDMSLMDNYIKKLTFNCNSCSANQKMTIEKFSKLLNNRWTDLIKEIEKEKTGSR
jgi:hypothetical protein